MNHINEHTAVRILRDCESDGRRIAKGTLGTVVAIYDAGAAYAVELEDASGATAVVTISHADLAEDGLAYQQRLRDEWDR